MDYLARVRSIFLRKALSVLVVVVSSAFLLIGTVKVTGQPQSVIEFQMTEYFIPFGLNRQRAFLIGMAELFGSITIWFHRKHWIGLVGAATLVVVTSGALTFHLTFDTFQQGTPALVMLILSALILTLAGREYLQRERQKAAA